MGIGLGQRLGQFVLTRGQRDRLAVGTFGLHFTVVSGHEDNQVGLFACLHGLGHQLGVGRLLRAEALVATAAVEALVTWNVGDFCLAVKCPLQSFEWRDFLSRLHAGTHTVERHLCHGILAYYGNALHTAEIDGQQRFLVVAVFEQYYRTASHLQGNGHFLGIAHGFGVGHLFGNRAYREAHAQNLAHALVDDLFADFPCLDRVEQRLAHVSAAGHLNVHSRGDGIHSGMHAAPVANHHAGESPLLSQDGVQQHLVFRAPASSHLVIGRHHAPGIGLAHGHLEGAQVDFVHGAVGDVHIHKAAIVFLVVQRIVFQAYCRAVFLTAARVGHGQCSAQQRVFAQIFVGASACGNALYVDGWSQNHVFSAQPGLATHAPSVGIGPLGAPCGGQCRTGGEEGCRVGGEVKRIP